MICSEMSSEIAALSEPDKRDAQGWDAAGDGCAAPSAERRLRMLDRLAEAGLEIALAVERQVKDAEPVPTLAELNVAAMAYGRAARAVRLAILLQEQLARGEVDPLETARLAEAGRRQAQVDRAVGIVRRVAKDHCGKSSIAAGWDVAEARERLDNDDIYGLAASRPLGELVAMICQDLGLKPDWDLLAGEAWAEAEIESGAEGSPFLEDWDEEEGEEPEPAPRKPTPSVARFQARLNALARDPAIIAAARRDSG